MPCAQVASLRPHESESSVSSGARGSKSSSAHHSPLPPSHIPRPAASPPRANSHESIAWEDGRTGGLHIFFIWVDPRSPLDDTLEEWPLPGKYAETVSQWRDRYSGAHVQVCFCHSVCTSIHPSIHEIICVFARNLAGACQQQMKKNVFFSFILKSEVV